MPTRASCRATVPCSARAEVQAEHDLMLAMFGSHGRERAARRELRGHARRRACSTAWRASSRIRRSFCTTPQRVLGASQQADARHRINKAIMRRSIVATMALLATGAALADSPLADAIEEAAARRRSSSSPKAPTSTPRKATARLPLHWAAYKLDLELVRALGRPRREGRHAEPLRREPARRGREGRRMPLTAGCCSKPARTRTLPNGDGETVADARGPHRLRRRREQVAARARRRRQRARAVARADGAHVGSRRRVCRAHAALDRPRRRRPRACGGERLGRADHDASRARSTAPPAA